jgi:hypothetical protein
MNLNNASGLLSSASIYDLWRLSVKNGSQQSFSEFNGRALIYTGTGNGALVPTIGSMFVVSPTDLSLPDNLSCGSLGAFSLQFSAQVLNQFSAAITVELVVIACNSGIMSLSQGTASLFTGLLTREAVLAAKKQPVSKEGSRMIGGRFGMLSNALARHPRMMDAVRGYMKGGVPSAGAMSAGRMDQYC